MPDEKNKRIWLQVMTVKKNQKSFKNSILELIMLKFLYSCFSSVTMSIILLLNVKAKLRS